MLINIAAESSLSVKRSLAPPLATPFSPLLTSDVCCPGARMTNEQKLRDKIRAAAAHLRVMERATQRFGGHEDGAV